MVGRVLLDGLGKVEEGMANFFYLNILRTRSGRVPHGYSQRIWGTMRLQISSGTYRAVPVTRSVNKMPLPQRLEVQP